MGDPGPQGLWYQEVAPGGPVGQLYPVGAVLAPGQRESSVPSCLTFLHNTFQA